MFRINGDVVKQLENIYEIRFKNKYKNDLKERILFFVNQINNENNIDLFVFNDTVLIAIKHSFFIQYKEELINSFNPLWFTKIKIERNYSKKEIYYITDMYLYRKSFQIKDSFIPKSISGPHNPDILDLNYIKNDFDKIVFSKKIKRQILYEIENILNTFFDFSYFKHKNFSLFKDPHFHSFILPTLIGLIDSFDYEEPQDLIFQIKNKIDLIDIKNDEEFLIFIFKIYYIVKINDLIKKEFSIDYKRDLYNISYSTRYFNLFKSINNGVFLRKEKNKSIKINKNLCKEIKVRRIY